MIRKIIIFSINILFLLLCIQSFGQNSISLEAKSEYKVRFNKIEIIILLRNNTDSLILLPKALNNSIYLNFNIHRIWPEVHTNFPSKNHRSPEKRNINSNCDLDSNIFISIPPHQTISYKIPIDEMYFGFQLYQTYDLNIDINIDDRYKHYCPNFFVKELSNSDNIKISII